MEEISATRKCVLLCTTRDVPISKLNSNRYLLEDIFKIIEKFIYEKYINRNDVSYVVWPRPMVSRTFCGNTCDIEFPTPTDLNINMMPIKLTGGYIDGISEEWSSFIRYHCFLRFNTIAYLTIHEGIVPCGQSQRRPGLHIERPGVVTGGSWHQPHTNEYKNIAWGLGAWRENGLPENGIFMASTVDNSCAVWDALIDEPEKITDKSGGIEHMRESLGTPRLLRANQMVWMTDRTPHESLPLQGDVYRQFFRLVVGPISVWYSQHNTPSTVGVQPEASISHDSKFACI